MKRAVIVLTIAALALGVTTAAMGIRLSSQERARDEVRKGAIDVLAWCMAARSAELDQYVAVARGTRRLEDVHRESLACGKVTEILAQSDPERLQLWLELAELFQDGGRLSVVKLATLPPREQDLNRIKAVVEELRLLLGRRQATTGPASAFLSANEAVLQAQVVFLRRL